MHPPFAVDASGHCATCHLRTEDIARVDTLIATGKATPVCQHACGHSSIYRSVGWWTGLTSLVARPVVAPPVRKPISLFVASTRD